MPSTMIAPTGGDLPALESDGVGAAAQAPAVPNPAGNPANPHVPLSAAEADGEERSASSERKTQPSGSPPQPASFPEHWRQELAAGDKAFLKTLDRFDSPVALAKAYKELTARLSSGEFRAVRPPPANASPEEIAKWRAEIGLPENAAAYVAGLALRDGTIPGEAEAPLLASFAEQAMKGNWTAEQYSQAVGWYFAMQDRMLAERQRADAQFKGQASAELLSEWKSDYAVNRNAVVQFFDRHFPQALKIELLNARLPDGTLVGNHPGFNRAILEIAKIVSPGGGALLPNTAGSDLSSVDGRISEIEGKYMRAPHGSEPWKAYWTGEAGARMQQEYRGLLAQRERALRQPGG